LSQRELSADDVRRLYDQHGPALVAYPAKLDAELTRESTKILPNFRSKESTLRVLAKE
jgi:hypothetical protein